MNILNRILILLLISEVSLLFLQTSSALFSDTAASSSNTFTAALEFSGPSGATGPSGEIGPTGATGPTGPSGIADHPVISEVQITSAGPGNTDHDFVEFYNPTSSTFDLNGHRLVKRIGSNSTDDTIKSWTSSAIIPAHGYYLWASSDDGYASLIGADASTSANIAASNSIALRLGAENTGVIIDQLSWNGASQSLKEGTEFSPNPPDDQSMERKAYSTSTVTSMMTGADINKGNGFDAGDNSTDFILRTTSDPQNSSDTPETP